MSNDQPDSRESNSRDQNERDAGNTKPDESQLNTTDAAASTDEVVRRLDNSNIDAPRVHMPLNDHVGHQVGRYAIKSLIGSGGHGVVYHAHDTELDREVALKIPRPEVLLDEDRRRRFVTEAKTAAMLDHPAIVKVYEAELSGATPYIASAYWPGDSLATWMDNNQGQQDGKDIAAFIEQLAQAVHYAHQNGVVHRDLKPSNVLLAQTETGSPSTLSGFQPRLTDFGLALLADSQLEDTKSSMMVGTPLYMSPEQASDRREEIGPAADIFSLGAILYHVLTGAPPFAAETYIGVISRIREGTIDRINSTNQNVDQDLETICMKCLQREPSDRYASADDLANDLRCYLSDSPIAARPPRAWELFTRWSCRQLRVSEATVAVILISIVRLVYSFLGLAMVRFAAGMDATNAEINDGMKAHLFVTAPTELWLIWAAHRNLNRKLSSPLYLATLIVMLIFCMATFLIAMQVIPAPLWYQRAPGARVTVFSIISLLFATQIACWYVADWNRVNSRKQTSWLHIAKRSILGLAAVTLTGAILFSYLLPVAPPQFAGPAQSRQFDGLDDHIAVRSVGFAESQPFTLEAWIRASDSRKSVIASYGPVSLGTVTTADGNRLRINIAHSRDGMYVLDTTDEFDNDEWTHLAVTFDRDSIYCFINGKPQTYNVASYEWDENDDESKRELESLPRPLPLKDIWPDSTMLVGCNKATGPNAYFFSGQVGEVRLTRSAFYRREFTPSENLSVGPYTEFLFRLNEKEVIDATGDFIAKSHR